MEQFSQNQSCSACNANNSLSSNVCCSCHRIQWPMSCSRASKHNYPFSHCPGSSAPHVVVHPEEPVFAARVCPGPVVGDPGWFCPPLLHHLPFAACFTKPTKSRSALGFGSILIYLFIHCCFTIIITWCMMKLLYSTRKRLCVTFFHLVFKNDVLKIGQFG